ncbi:hypothetical protein TBLA_0C04200 [Henningerozyma blattae CBS 6284]|uniref:Mitochondrial group I intron splicing factor CCM1 n=1 Tax=Henningerozyma blattae (strain ATCC 34711 / CBS 6284 / DSM 70876 / NBRC 10599 / NRRL Y-10934 / UCD 77-7) TaxID=1071380 RepID=I2H1G8_HENB6|nr:hypothetical protein TBLA_0C04200 [Tetrapisispora blattae CBS 6284]CCH60220.1 hypothetical protein TBLA_0C04200 [Tetrapisispora blattae CBS 6284]
MNGFSRLVASKEARHVYFRVGETSSLTHKRWVTVIPKARANKLKLRKVKNVTIQDINLEGVDKASSKELEFKIKQLQEFTNNLKNNLRAAEKERKALKQKQHAQSDSLKQSSEDKSELFQKLFGDTSKQHENNKSLLRSSTTAYKLPQPDELLPPALVKNINDNNLITRALIDQSYQDWNLIVSSTYSTKNRLRNISKKQLAFKFLNKIQNLSLENIERLIEMLDELNYYDSQTFRNSFFNCIFKNLSKIPYDRKLIDPKHGNDPVISKMKDLLIKYDKLTNVENPTTKASSTMTGYILNCCITYASNMKSFDNMEYFLSKFKNDYGIIPNKQNSTVIIQFYTKLGCYKQAWDVFDAMKFMSESTFPSEITYNSVIQLCAKEKNYSRAIDLYNEMQDKNIKISVRTLSTLAKTLATSSSDNITSEGKAESLRLYGWKYIHMIEQDYNLRDFISDSNDKDAFFTLEAMLALAAYDGDIALARALYFKAITQKYKYELINPANVGLTSRELWKKTLYPQLLNYLMLAYQRYSTTSLPILLGYSEGIILRRNIVNSVDYDIRDYGDNIKLPMLPLKEINQPWQILAESRALWHFNLDFGNSVDLRQRPSELNVDLLKNFRQNCQTFSEFKFEIMYLVSKWKEELVNSTILNPITLNTYLSIAIKQGNDKHEYISRLNEFSYEQHVLDAILQDMYNKLETENSVPTSNNSLSKNIDYLGSLKHKILRNENIYEVTLKAAMKFNDYDMATNTWNGRGYFRKTDAFQKLDKKERVCSDQIFAQCMVDFFTQAKMYEDAIKLILSTQRGINWTYSMVKNLYRGLQEIEDSHSTRILSEVINKKTKIQIIEQKLKDLDI